MGSVSMLKQRWTDDYLKSGRTKSLPILLQEETGAIFSICRASANTFWDTYDIFEKESVWIDNDYGEWGTVGKLYPLFSDNYPDLFENIKKIQENDPNAKLLNELLFIPRIYIKALQGEKQTIKKQIIDKLACACWHTLLVHKVFSLTDKVADLRNLFTSFKTDEDDKRGGLLLFSVCPYLPPRVDEAQWGLSGIILMMFRIFSEIIYPDLIYSDNYPDSLFSENAHEYATNIYKKLVSIWGSEVCLAYRKETDTELPLLPDNVDESKTELVHWCLGVLPVIFRAYIYNEFFRLRKSLSVEDQKIFDEIKFNCHDEPQKSISNKNLIAYLTEKYISNYKTQLSSIVDSINNLPNSQERDLLERKIEIVKEIRAHNKDTRRTITLVCVNGIASSDKSSLIDFHSKLEKDKASLKKIEDFEINELKLPYDDSLVVSTKINRSFFDNYLSTLEKSEIYIHSSQ